MVRLISEANMVHCGTDTANLNLAGERTLTAPKADTANHQESVPASHP